MRILPAISIILIALTANHKGFAAPIDDGIMQEATPPALDVMQSNGVTLGQAVEQVRRQYKGTIVSAETRCQGGRETHFIRVLTEDGKVKNVTIPGKRCG